MKLFLQDGDWVRVTRPGFLKFSYAGNHYRMWHGVFHLKCRRLLLDSGVFPAHRTMLAVNLLTGRMYVRAGGLARQALVLTPEMLALATIPRTNFVVDRNPKARGTHAWTMDKAIVAARASSPKMRIRTRITYTAISNPSGLRLDVWPFGISRLQRAPTGADGLVSFWDDGQECSVGCEANGANPGWPVWPFHQQHAIRSALNEVRPSGPHVAIDIDTDNFQPVYAIQSGYVHIRYPDTADVNVDVGNFDYWHINPTVSEGQYAEAYVTELGWVLYDFKHVAFSEIGPGGDYINPLRPGGSLLPYTDTEPPIIGTPEVFGDGRVIIGAFDPQSFVDKRATYETPVLAPAALAWRLFDARGHDLTGLQWALRGSQLYSPDAEPTIYAPGAMNPGYDCFAYSRVCIPNWVYWLAGGLTEPLPLDSLPRGRYRLAVYAWDWTGNTSALDHWITVPLAHAASEPFGPLNAQYEP